MREREWEKLSNNKARIFSCDIEQLTLILQSRRLQRHRQHETVSTKASSFVLFRIARLLQWLVKNVTLFCWENWRV